MNFELREPNKQYSKRELIEDLKRVAKELGKDSLTQREYDKHGKFSYQTRKKRFSSWLKALEKADLGQSKRPWGGDLSETRIPKERLLDDLKKVSEKLDKKSITISDYDEHGESVSLAKPSRYLTDDN